MKNRYDGIPGKEADRSRKLNKMYQAEHSSNNEFVKKQQAMTAGMGMKTSVNLAEKYTNIDACMISDGEHAQEFARKLTSGFDKKAFPVK
jgi:hypothetical protein